MHRVTCPHCGRALRVAEELPPAARVTCPRCFHRVPNPGQPEGVRAGEPAGPHDYFDRRPMVLAVDEESRLESARTTGCMSLLAVLGALGLMLAWFGIAPDVLGRGGGLPEGVVALMGISFALLVGIGFFLQAQSSNPTAQSLGQAIVVLFAVAGALAATGLAMLILFFIVCLMTWKGSW